MKNEFIKPVSGVKKTIVVQGDKSISHRSVIIGSLAKGVTKVSGFLEAEDTLNTIKIFRQLGVKIIKKGPEYFIYGEGLRSFKKPSKTLYVGNSGTGIRLILGVLAAQKFKCTITGDKQIVKRPMNRIMQPLSLMGAKFESNNGYAPITVIGGRLKGIKYKSPVASAQVKSGLLLAGLFAEGKTTVTEPEKSRDHTERMLKYFGADITVKGNTVTLKPGRELKARKIFVPSDISSAAYFMVAGAILKGGSITVKHVGVNGTRTGIIDVMKKMGAKLKISKRKILNGEPVADITVSYSNNLKAVKINGSIIPRLIDEIPVIAVLASFAKGKTEIKNAKELRVKETDRIKTVLENLKRIDVKTEEYEDGFAVYGDPDRCLKYAEIESHGDHRIAMSFAVAALASEKGLKIKNTECVNTSFPEFFRILKDISK